MANTPSISTAARSAAADAVTALIGASGLLRIYEGAVPATAQAALGGGNNVLAELPLSADAFADAVAGVSTANAITSDSSADKSGTATFFRVLTSGGTCVMQGSVGTSGCDLNLSTTSIVLGGTVTVTSLTYTQAGS
jgi:hypothetical protein